MCASKNRMRVTHALLKVCALFGCQLHHRHAIANVSTQVGRICVLVLYNYRKVQNTHSQIVPIVFITYVTQIV